MSGENMADTAHLILEEGSKTPSNFKTKKDSNRQDKDILYSSLTAIFDGNHHSMITSDWMTVKLLEIDQEPTVIRHYQAY